MIAPSDFRYGLLIEVDGTLYMVVGFQHVKMARRNAFVRAKIKNLETGSIIEKTFNPGDRINKPDVEKRKVQYLYEQGDSMIFMDMETYEQYELRKDDLGDTQLFVTEGIEMYVLFYKAKPVMVELPNFVELEIVETEPSFKGDTVSGGKPAKLSTGLVVNVPFFIERGDIVKVDTRKKEYVERVKKR